MATSKDYIAFVCDQLRGIENITCQKMFGEYLVYASGKPVLLVCDNTVMVKKLPELAALMQGAPEAYPYEGAKLHYVLDIENRALTEQAVALLEEITPLPKRRKKGRVSREPVIPR